MIPNVRFGLLEGDSNVWPLGDVKNFISTKVSFPTHWVTWQTNKLQNWSQLFYSNWYWQLQPSILLDQSFDPPQRRQATIRSKALEGNVGATKASFCHSTLLAWQTKRRDQVKLSCHQPWYTPNTQINPDSDTFDALALQAVGSSVRMDET